MLSQFPELNEVTDQNAHPTIAAAAIAQDRDWFDRHPHRNFRVRGLVPGEMPTGAKFGGNGIWSVIIVRMNGADAPVRFVRRSIAMPKDTDEVLDPIVWDLITRGNPALAEAVR